MASIRNSGPQIAHWLVKDRRSDVSARIRIAALRLGSDRSQQRLPKSFEPIWTSRRVRADSQIIQTSESWLNWFLTSTSATHLSHKSSDITYNPRQYWNSMPAAIMQRKAMKFPHYAWSAHQSYPHHQSSVGSTLGVPSGTMLWSCGIGPHENWSRHLSRSKIIRVRSLC